MITILNERKIQIILELINKNGKSKIEDVAKQFKVSERTIRYDLNGINTFIKIRNLPMCLKVKDGFVMLYNRLYSKSETISLFNSIGIDFVQNMLSPDERKYFILNELFFAKSFITINYLADKIFVSRNTIINDLNKVKDWLAENEIEFISISSKGLKIDGKEKRLRNGLLRLFKEALTVDQYIGLAQKDSVLSNDNKYPQILYNNLFNGININQIRQFLEGIQKKHKIIFSDLAYSDLIICLAVVIQRIKLQKTIIMKNKEKLGLMDTDVFKTVKSESKMIRDFFGIDITNDEIVYITQYILACNISKTSTVEEYHNKLESQILIINLITNVSKQLNRDLTNDWQLFDDLCVYILPFIYGQEHEIIAYNPYTQEIKIYYPQIFDAIRSNIIPIEEYIGKKIKDDAIGYMTLHFAATLESQNNVNILVLCGSGFATANLLSIKLKAMFNVNIVGNVALHAASDIINECRVDLIVTTAPFIYNGIPCIMVNPLLTKEDITLLREAIEKCKNSKQKLSILSNYNDTDNFCIKEVNDFDRRNKEIIPLGHIYNSSLQSLDQVLSEDRIALNVEVNNWQDAIRYCGGLLLKKGDIQEECIESMIECVNQKGPYIVFWKGIALPHSERYDLSNRLSVGFIRLKNPVNFGHKKNDPVDLIFILATPNKKCHVKVMMQLSDLLSDDNVVTRLRIEEETNKIVNLITYVCKQKMLLLGN